MKRFVTVALVAVAVVVTTAASDSTTTTTTEASPDVQLARTGVLVATDFPAGWTETARGPDSDEVLDARAAKIPRCGPFRTFTAENRRQPRARSEDFEHGGAEVNNTVSVYPSTARAGAAMATFRDRRVPGCLERLFTGEYRRQLEKNKKVAKQLRSVTTTLGREDGVRLGDEAIVYQGTVDVGLKNGTKQTIGLGFLAVRAGRALSGYSYISDTDVSAALQPAIVASVSRLQRAAPAG